MTAILLYQPDTGECMGEGGRLANSTIQLHMYNDHRVGCITDTEILVAGGRDRDSLLRTSDIALSNML